MVHCGAIELGARNTQESSDDWVMTGVEPRVQGKYGSTDPNQEVNMAPTSNQEKGLKKGKYRLTEEEEG